MMLSQLIYMNDIVLCNTVKLDQISWIKLGLNLGIRFIHVHK